MSKPSLYVVRQDRGGIPRYIASTIGQPDADSEGEAFAWMTTKSVALRLCRSTARRLASIAAIENGRAAMVLPYDEV